MEFIEEGENESGQECDCRPRPKPTQPWAERTKEEPAQNRVFGHVRSLAHKQMRLEKRSRGDVGIKPKQKREQKTRSMFGRHEIGRTEKHQSHPDHDRQPGLENFAPIQGRSLNGGGCLTNRRSRVNLAAEVAPVLDQPLVFEPLFQERVWGGRSLESLFQKKLPVGRKIGESWEIVDRSEAQSVVRQGALCGKTLHQLWLEHRAEIFGAAVPATPRFPILAKLLDAQERLSIQVHPGPVLARALSCESKTEMWYIAAAEPGAEIFFGLRRGVDRARLRQAVSDGTAADLVHRIAAHPGDVFFVPSGRVHAIGAGALLIEIQENSDTTFRLFDWNRTAPGNMSRPLQIEEALQAIDFEDFEPGPIQPKAEVLLRCPHFAVEKWDLEKARQASDRAAFALFVCLQGAVEMKGLVLRPGEFFLVPANAAASELQPAEPGTSLLRVTLPTR